MIKKILIIGAGGQSKEVIHYIRRINEVKPQYELAGILDDNVSLHGKKINNIKVLGGIDWLENIKSEDYVVNLALGEPSTKKKVLDKL